MKDMQKNFTVRRHLSKGKNFGFIQIRGYISDSKQGAEIEYVNPETHTVIFNNCILHNKINQSIKIFKTKEKAPCAYIIFESYEVVPLQPAVSNVEVRYNPVLCPNWQVDGNTADQEFIACIASTCIEINEEKKMKLFVK